jgi:ATP-dependent DNA helicase RecQ
VAAVLCGAHTARIAQLGHERLTSYGSLRGEKKSQVRAWIDQLMAQGHLARSDDEYPTLSITASGASVLRGERLTTPLTSAAAPSPPLPVKPAAPPAGRGGEPTRGAVGDGPEITDSAVFEALRALRRKIAEERGVPPYLIFSDASLRDMARVRPMTLEHFSEVKGVGDWKLETFGERFVAAVRQACLASSSAQRE